MDAAARNGGEAAARRSVRSSYQPLVAVLVACCAGMVVDRSTSDIGLPIAVWVSWSAALAALVGWGLAWRAGWSLLSMGLVLASVAATAATWHHVCWNLFSPRDLGHFARVDMRPVCVQALALGAPRRIPASPPDPLQTMNVGDRSRLVLRAVSIRDGVRWCPARGKATLLVVGHLLGVQAGDRLRVFAKLSRTVPARNPGEFDFAGHARANRQLAVLRAESPDCVTVLARGSPWWPVAVADRLRNWGNRLLWRELGRRQSGLAAAVLLGAREQVGAERTASFITTGTVHLLVVSGLHMGILAGGLFLVLRLGLLPRRTALVLVALLVVAYAMLTEARPPVVRACVLVVVLCVARLTGRRALAFNSLALAALVVLVLNPADLFRTGPQLSFLAVAALAWLGNRRSMTPMPDALDQLLIESRPWPFRAARWGGRWIGQVTLASAVVWLALEPLVMAHFHLLTPVAVVLSPLLWLPVATSLMAGFGVLLFGWLVPPLGHLCAWSCDASLGLLERCVTTAAALPGGHFWVAGPADWWLAVFYGGLALLAAFPPLRPPRRWVVGLAAGWAAVGLFAAAARHGRLECTFLSVGHGCAVVAQLPGGRTLLYDCGSLGPPHSGARTVAWYLWSRGITRLDAVILSHADVDHYNALPELVDRFPVGTVLVSPSMFQGDGPGLRALRSALAAANVPIRTVWAGDRLITEPGVTMAVLHPPWQGVAGSDNANSIVLEITFAGRRILLPGDLESPGLEWVTCGPARDCTVLLAPHHGSRRSDPAGFARWCTPDWVIVSGGLQDTPQQAAATYRRFGATVLHTAVVGAVRVSIDAGQMDVTTFIRPPAAAAAPRPVRFGAAGHPAGKNLPESLSQNRLDRAFTRFLDGYGRPSYMVESGFLTASESSQLR